MAKIDDHATAFLQREPPRRSSPCELDADWLERFRIDKDTDDFGFMEIDLNSGACRFRTLAAESDLLG